MRLLQLRWLTGERVVLYGSIICTLYAAILLFGVLFGGERPNRVDFVAFHAAGRLAMGGEAAAAYDWDRMRHAQAVILGVEADSIEGFLGWLNPPHFFFAVMPLSGLSYAWAWFAWILACSVIFAFAIQAVMPGVAPVVAAFCTPSVLISLGIGQNGVLIASLMAWSLGLLDRKPIGAGLALGLLTVKPQFGLLFPLLLALTGRWRVFAMAAATALALMAASWIAFGTEAWLAMLPALSDSTERYLIGDSDVRPRVQSVHSFVLLISGQRALAWAVHGAFALVVVALVLRLWLRRPEGPEESRAAAAIAATYLISPYAWIYDTPAIAVAAIFLARAGRRDGFLGGEKLLLIGACAAIVLVLAWRSHPLIAPAAWLLILALAWRRDRAWRRARPCAATA